MLQHWESRSSSRICAATWPSPAGLSVVQHVAWVDQDLQDLSFNFYSSVVGYDEPSKTDTFVLFKYQKNSACDAERTHCQAQLFLAKKQQEL